jgi:hypothetical protein
MRLFLYLFLGIHSAGKVTGTYGCKLNLNSQNKLAFEEKVPVT